MKSLHRNKKGVSAAGLTELDYSVLNYEELLAVNGAGGRGSTGGGGAPEGPSEPSNSNSGNLNSTTYYDDNGNNSKDPYVVTGKNVGEPLLSPKDILQPIAQSSVDNKDKYGAGNTCDEFAAKTLSSGGYNPNDYYLGNTKDQVSKHIAEMKTSGIDYSAPSSNANIFFYG